MHIAPIDLIIVIVQHSGRVVNRGFATLLAGTLGVGAHRIASFSGEICEPILLGLFVFILVSGYRDDEVLEMAHRRLSTILIGGASAVIVCVCICPVWAGDDLHNLVASNLEKLGTFLEGFGSEYFKKQSNGESTDDKALLQGYKSVLNSKSTEESWANFAKWEPRHGKFKYRHPWEKYLRIGSLTRQCACRIDALNAYLNSDLKACPEMQAKIEESSTKLSTECSYALKELALSVKTMTMPSTANSHMANSKIIAKTLKSLLETGSWQGADLLDIIPAATVASLLIDVATCTEKIAESVNELASLAKFNSVDDVVTKEPPPLTSKEMLRPCSSIEEPPHHVVTIQSPGE
ncbi:hypothetical protein HYC85_031055 [Camellia sinensis]|uniref:Aluminum-activated malate transporter n=1 Tax=Camellia sinensis TaxID=4442 RepID=A0A7J7FPX4_CAMSI|nr:hypothetical protein HYC85_031055 [Camellia sinensis]